jgi:hypothetical protein
MQRDTLALNGVSEYVQNWMWQARENQPTFLENFAVQEYTALRQCFYKENRVW